MTTNERTPEACAADVRASLTVLCTPGEVYELRALDVPRRYGAPCTFFGFFDDLDRLAEEAARLDANRPGGVYLTLNPVNRDLLARVNNRVRKAGQGEAATDADTLRREWFPVDTDPVRLKGISATDAELAEGLARAEAIREHLDAMGFPPPVRALSGNGGHLLYRVELPADDGGLLRRCTAALAALFTDGAVEVDRAVHNAARIWKLYGTTARKGDPLPHRPHRVARILDVPADLAPVPLHLLEALAAEGGDAPPAEPERGKTASGGGGAPPENPADLPPDDAELLTRARNAKNGDAFAALYDRGQLGADKDHSTARMRLLLHLAFWTGNDAGRMERLARASALRVDKWDERRGETTLLAFEIAKAIGMTTDTYKPGRGGSRRKAASEPHSRAAGDGGAESRPASGDAPEPPPEAAPGNPEPIPWQPFPTDALPPAVGAFVRATARAMGCDEAMVALPALAVLAAGVGNSYRVRLKSVWDEPSTLWTAPVADSGGKKSPPLAAAVAPVLALQREANRQHDAEREAYEALPKDGKKDAARPRRKRYRTGDVTLETVALLHAENPRGLLCYRDELAGWFGGMNQYKRGSSDEQGWIEMSGGRPLTVDRKSAEVPALFIERPHACVTGSIQPEVLREHFTAARLFSGFAARVLLSAPPGRPRRWSEAEVDPDTVNAYHALIFGLYALRPDHPDAPEPLPLSADARAAFVAWYDENGAHLDTLPSGAYKAACSKLEALPARLALAFELADCVAEGREPDRIRAEPMRRGIVLARWFRRETARVYRALDIGEASLSRDERLFGDLPDPFGWKDVASLWGVKRRAAFNVIRRLQEAGLAEDDGHGAYRKCTVHFVPSLHSLRPDEQGEPPLVHRVHEVQSAPAPDAEAASGEAAPRGDGHPGLPPACLSPASGTPTRYPRGTRVRTPLGCGAVQQHFADFIRVLLDGEEVTTDFDPWDVALEADPTDAERSAPF